MVTERDALLEEASDLGLSRPLTAVTYIATARCLVVRRCLLFEVFLARAACVWLRAEAGGGGGEGPLFFDRTENDFSNVFHPVGGLDFRCL